MTNYNNMAGQYSFAAKDIVTSVWANDAIDTIDQKITRTARIGNITVNFGSPDLISKSGYDFLNDGVKPGDFLWIENATDAVNNGLFEVDTVSSTTIQTIEQTIVTRASDNVDIWLLQAIEGIRSDRLYVNEIGEGTINGDIQINDPIKVDVINEKTAAAGVTIDGSLIKDGVAKFDTINEKTTDNGVTVDGMKIKDGYHIHSIDLDDFDHWEISSGTPILSGYGGSDTVYTRWVLVNTERIRRKMKLHATADITKCHVRVLARTGLTTASLSFKIRKQVGAGAITDVSSHSTPTNFAIGEFTSNEIDLGDYTDITDSVRVFIEDTSGGIDQVEIVGIKILFKP